MFSRKFKESSYGKKLDEELLEPYDKSQSHQIALSFSPYSLSKWELFRACASRELLLMKMNSFIYIFKITQVKMICIFVLLYMFLDPLCFFLLLFFLGKGVKTYAYSSYHYSLFTLSRAQQNLKHVLLFQSADYYYCMYHNDSVFTDSHGC